MFVDPALTKPVKIDDLLLRKQLAPLSQQQIRELEKIAQLDVTAFNEAEVRFSVIDPIVRLLGYDKGTIFSANLEHPLKFLDKNIYADYQFAFWNENFWLIEAKKPRLGADSFLFDDLIQAIQYSVHPTINAALVVLCDGLKLEIFDREASVDAPMLRVPIKDLAKEFDKIRAVLDPIQIWFFQKRRIVRMLDKVFDKEFNMHRVEEFTELVDRRLGSKRQLIVENFRQTVKSDSPQQIAAAETASIEDLTELYIFSELPIPVTNAVNRRLVALSLPNSFPAMLRIFPDQPRDANDIYMAQALAYCMRLAEQTPTVRLLPGWLAQGRQGGADLDAAIKFLLKQCLTYFEDYEPYRLILLAACSLQRIAKVLAITNASIRQLGQELFALARYSLPEISRTQIVASPEGQMIGLMDGQTRAGVKDFVKKNTGENGHFLAASAKQMLGGYWQFEAKLLESVGDYPKLKRERSLGEMRMIECSAVTYDNLGHAALCLMHPFPKWKAYALNTYRQELETLASMGSHAAKGLLGIPIANDPPTISDDELASRFFFGDRTTLTLLRTRYGE